MATTVQHFDVPYRRPNYPAQLRKPPIEYTPNEVRTQQVLLGFSFEFFVTEDGQVAQYPEPLNRDAASV
jgi:hypothetical protein